MRTLTYYPQVLDDPNQNIGEGLRHAQVPSQDQGALQLLRVRGRPGVQALLEQLTEGEYRSYLCTTTRQCTATVLKSCGHVEFWLKAGDRCKSAHSKTTGIYGS